jgi:hypothetical protein
VSADIDGAWPDEAGEPEWDSEDSNRYQDRVERSADALGYTLAGNLEDAATSVCGLGDADLEAVHKALGDLDAVVTDELGRRHS